MFKDLSSLIYYFEHQFLPKAFFSEEYDLVASLMQNRMQNRNILFEIFQNMCKDSQIISPYAEQDFKIKFFKMDDTWYAIVITFFEPLESPQCYQAYLFFKEHKACAGFYTLEKAEQGFSSLAFLGGWEYDIHGNYGLVPLTGNEAFEKAFLLHKRRYEK